MSAIVRFSRNRTRLEARGHRPPARRDGDVFEDRPNDRERSYFPEIDGDARRDDSRRRRRGKHGCDRVHGQGLRRQID